MFDTCMYYMLRLHASIDVGDDDINVYDYDSDGNNQSKSLCFIRLELNDFYGQKPTSFDPMSGSITLSSMPNTKFTSVDDNNVNNKNQALLSSTTTTESRISGPTFQFCIRDSVTARQDLETAMTSLQNKLSIYNQDVDKTIADSLKDVNTYTAGTTATSSSLSKPLALFMLGSIERGMLNSLDLFIHRFIEPHHSI